ncbi:MAG: hypothetical protein HW414_1036 [Dehalococcoidia bacterium]|nr:hypothetical protein [Dehalococcoidia bacterium]
MPNTLKNGVDRIRAVTDFPSLLDYLRDELEWPVEDCEPDELTFEWSADTLHVAERHADALAGGQVRQVRSMAPDQPWGIFLVEFNDDRVHTGLLREILRGLVANRRRDPHLPTWQHGNLLFVCTTRDYERITFAHFRGEKMQKARLAMFGWRRESPYLRTLCEFNLPALHWPADPGDHGAWLKTWAAAFDKEPLTREFFKRFDKALEAIKTDLEKLQSMPSADAYSRAQLLLERLLFLYFLQNRGWLNRQRGYLLANFAPYRDRPDECSYYEEFLETLFFTLATAPGHPSRLQGIPFLNGGLFDDDEFPLPSSKQRKDYPPLLVRNGTFGFVFDHLLEAFNFTVREDTPLDQDVAVDPEMLGKVFESIVLHAEATADYNAPDKRKATGSYYTPRIVVHFICRESLRLYLKGRLSDAEWEVKIRALFDLDAAGALEAEDIALLKTRFRPADGRRLLDIISRIKMCDPAVGSGAFPVGLLHELINIRRIAETIANGFVDPARRQGSNRVHQKKADIVENCLYGVDIQQQAIEICRLRLWLSLIVDYDLGLDPFEADPSQFRQAILSISRLPNLEMNFRRGDSLLDYISDVNVRVAPERSERYREDYVRIHELGRKLHHAGKSDRKRELRIEILRNRLNLSERVLADEKRVLTDANSQLTLSLVSATESEAAKRRQVEQEAGRLQEALQKVAADRRALERIASRPLDSQFYPELRKLEGADFDSPFNFSWRIDFADIFQGDAGGFDLILGNPPFVTARNPKKRELYRERWKRVCSGKYLLVCPFFDLSFGLLRPGGQLGFIVSNAFAKREFGKPLVEDFFPTVDLQQVVDCSGLMFPGHGTPTCIVFGRGEKPAPDSPIRVAATLPGGGDLRTPPEESPLWRALEAHHDDPGYADERITVADRPRKEMSCHPWSLDASADDSMKALVGHATGLLRDVLADDIGVCTMTNADDVFLIDDDVARRYCLPLERLPLYHQGEEFKNWEADTSLRIALPYDSACQVDTDETIDRSFRSYLLPFRGLLEKRHTFGNQTFKEAGRVWFEFERMNASKYATKEFITFAHLSTHNHFIFFAEPRVYGRHSQVIKLPRAATGSDHHLLAGLLNSSAALFWLKQVCFNKGAGEDEERDRFEFAGGRVQQLPVPNAVADALRGKRSDLPDRLAALSQSCWERGRQMPALAMKKLFEKPGEAYHEWNSSLPGYVAPDPRLGRPFQTAEDLRQAFSNTCRIRETLRSDMIGLQEEMDWLVYAAYGLVPSGSAAVGQSSDPAPLAREQRPFVLLAEAGGDFEKAVALIPHEWARQNAKHSGAPGWRRYVIANTSGASNSRCTSAAGMSSGKSATAGSAGR